MIDLEKEYERYGSKEAYSAEMSRRAKGNKGPRKYSDKVIRDILESSEGLTALAKKHGMHYTQVWKIKTGKIRTH
jgi:hypothetical protein